MHATPLVTATLVLLMAGPAAAQDWSEYTSRDDLFTVNFPGRPEIRETTYASEYGVKLPSRVYSAGSATGRYSVTVVDYRTVQQIHATRLEGCHEADVNLCTNPYINELRGAMDFAAWSFMQRDARLTDYAYYNADRVEGRRLQLLNRDGTRTFAAINMHDNRLYIIEGTVPANLPPPGLFQQSIGWVDKDGIRIRYEAIYANMYAPPKRIVYAPSVPDLRGMKMGETRRFTDGPFAGQTWGVDGSGSPYQVQEDTQRNLAGVP